MSQTITPPQLSTAPHPATEPLHGFVIINKDVGDSSTQAMAKTRRLFQGKKVGHGGTLDPFARGVLVVALGEATKTLPYILHGDKEYEFTVQFGAATDSQDLSGRVVAENPMRPDLTAITAILPRFTGTIMQTPPIFSALKINGERAYDLARRGEAPAMTPRQVTIDSLTLIDQPDRDHATFRVTCQSGLYVRTLGHDLAAALGTVGHLTELTRRRVGHFHLDNAFSLANLAKINYSERVATSLLAIHGYGGGEMLARLIAVPTITIDLEQAATIRLGKKTAFYRTSNLAQIQKLNNTNNKLPRTQTGYTATTDQPELDLLAIDSEKKPVGFVRYSSGLLQPKKLFVF